MKLSVKNNIFSSTIKVILVRLSYYFLNYTLKLFDTLVYYMF